MAPATVEQSREPLTVHVFPALQAMGVDAFVTDRRGGVSAAPYATLNLGDHVGDEPNRVAENRRRVARAAGVDHIEIVRQVHGASVADGDLAGAEREADALTLTTSSRAVAVLVADCVPLVFVDGERHRLSVVHAGWRGLAAGVIASAVAATTPSPADLVVGVGPCVSVERYQVGPEVATHFREVSGAVIKDVGDRSRLDLRAIVRHQLLAAGVDPGRLYLSADSTDGGQTYFSDRAQRPCGRFGLVARWLVP